MLDAVAANLSILKSPTVMRQADGRFWSWEGSGDRQGSCHGSCTHVLNYAQALCHLFPDLERSLRDTEFHECQDERGDQRFRAPLPIRVPAHQHHPAGGTASSAVSSRSIEITTSAPTGTGSPVCGRG